MSCFTCKAAAGGKKQRPEYRRPKAEKRRDARSSLYSIGDVRQVLAQARLVEMESRHEATDRYVEKLRKAFGR
jgi:hypothetical protein